MEDPEILPVGVPFLLDPLLAHPHCTSLVGVQIKGLSFPLFLEPLLAETELALRPRKFETPRTENEAGPITEMSS